MNVNEKLKRKKKRKTEAKIIIPNGKQQQHGKFFDMWLNEIKMKKKKKTSKETRRKK